MFVQMHSIKIFLFGLLLTTSSASALSIERIDFIWSDINTRDVLEWKGDMAILRRGSATKELSCRVTINSKDVDAAIDRFGIPKSWTSFTYKDDDDLVDKQYNLQKKAALHGIKMLKSGNQFVVDYTWVVNEDSRKLRDVAKLIQSTARRQGYRSRREIVGAFASFVQSLKYQLPPDQRVNDDGEVVLTVGAMMPLDTLFKQWGDCDSKSMLFAALVRSINLVNVTFIIMEDHLFAAVQLSPDRGEHYIRHNGDKWVLVELTDAWPLGRVPEKHLRNINSGDYRVVDLE